MLDFQVTQANFRYGVAEDQEPHQVPPGTLLTAENVVWKKSGRIEKRLGTTALTRSIIGGGTLSVTARLFPLGDELCAIDGAYLYSYSTALTAWRTVDQVPDVGLTSSTLLDAQAGVAASDIALSSGGLLVHAWLTGDPTSQVSGALYVQVLDRASGATVIAPTSLSSSGNLCVRAIVIGTKAIVLSINSTNVQAFTIDLTTLAVSGATNLRTDAPATTFQGLDACVIGSNFVIAYSKTAATAIYSYNASLVQQATATVEAVACGAVSLDGASGESLYVLYVTGSAIHLAVHDATTLTQTVAPVSVEALSLGYTAVSVVRYSATSCIVAYTTTITLGSGITTVTATTQVSSAGTIGTLSVRGSYNTVLLTRPFMLGGRCYVFLADYQGVAFKNTSPPGINTGLFEVAVSSNGGTTFVPHRYVGKSEHLIGARPRNICLSNAVAVSSTSLLCALPFQTAAPATSNTWRCGARLVNATVGASLPADMWRSCTFGREAYVLGGLLAAYDKRSCFDYGFPHAPSAALLTPGTVGSMLAGNYTYAYHLEFRSNAGVLHRSATAVSSPVAVAGSGSVDESIIGCNIGNKRTLSTSWLATALSTLCVLSRSAKDGSIYYRETFDPSFNVLTVNELTQPQTFTDTRNDNNIDAVGTPLASRPTLYTTGGVLDDESPPGGTTMVLFKDRLWIVDPTRLQAWFSKSFLDDYGTAPGFSTSFRVQFDAPVTALASVDEKLLAFASDRLWAVLGDGPAPNGDNGDFQVTPIQTSVGCSNPRSVVSMADGVMFLSSRGFYMVTRKLEVVFVGGAVQDQLASYPNVTSAVLVAKRNEVRWTCNDASSTAGVVLIYNYVQQQWSTARYTANSVYGVPFADACIWQGQWTAVTPDGFVLQESESTYLDGAAWVPMTIETAWVSGAGPVGYAAVDSMSLAGVSKSNHDLSISVGFDGEATYAQSPQTFTAGSAVTSVGPLEECKVSIGTRRWCQAIRFKIQDATPTNPGTYPVGTGQGATFDTLGLEIGIERGLRRLPATKKG